LEGKYITEVDVLVAVAKWLHSEGWKIKKVSPTGGGEGVNKVKAEFTTIGIPINSIQFSTRGEDIGATKGNVNWRIECKGFSSYAASPTIRNNFDRAIASAVSYYNKRDDLRLGLAVPEEYIGLIKDRVPQALREAVNLWVLLYVSADEEVYALKPDEEI
jgi:hypothetical protein